MTRIFFPFLIACLICCKTEKKIANNNPSPSLSHGLAGKIIRGNDLQPFSQVAFYYDSLRRNLPKLKETGWDSYELPEVMFVPGWGEWICNEDRFHHKAIVTDTVPGNEDAINSEYTDYFQESEYEVTVNGDFISVRTNQQNVLKNHLNVTEVKLFYGNNNLIVLGIKESESSIDADYWTASDFFILKNGIWEKYTDAIFGKPDPAAFFNDTVNIGLVKKYDYIDFEIGFGNKGDTVTAIPYEKIQLNCSADNGDTSNVPIKNQDDRNELCKYDKLLKREGIAYVFNKGKLKFYPVSAAKKTNSSH